jgi:hypothetical protein
MFVVAPECRFFNTLYNSEINIVIMTQIIKLTII